MLPKLTTCIEFPRLTLWKETTDEAKLFPDLSTLHARTTHIHTKKNE